MPHPKAHALLIVAALLLAAPGCSSSGTSSRNGDVGAALDDAASEDTEVEALDGAPEDAPREDTAPQRDALAEDVEADTAPSACEEGYASPIDAGAMQDPAVIEASGLVASRQSPGVLWLHNDSGDGALLYALATDGRALGRLTLPDVEARDFEDIALGPCPEGEATCLWIADVGNNAGTRDDLTLYATPEPEMDVDEPIGEVTAEQVWAQPIAYPDDGGVDCEAVVVGPGGGAIYLFEKVDEAQARVFRLAAPWGGERRVVEEVARIISPGVPVERGLMITGADLHPGGRRLALRLYTGSFEYRLAEGQGVEQLAEVEPLLVAAGPLSEPQGEAIGYDASGLGLWTVSEDRQGQPGQQLHFYGCDEGGVME